MITLGDFLRIIFLAGYRFANQRIKIRANQFTIDSSVMNFLIKKITYTLPDFSVFIFATAY